MDQKTAKIILKAMSHPKPEEAHMFSPVSGRIELYASFSAGHDESGIGTVFGGVIARDDNGVVHLGLVWEGVEGVDDGQHEFAHIGEVRNYIQAATALREELRKIEQLYRVSVENDTERHLRETADAQGYREAFFGLLTGEGKIGGVECTYHDDGDKPYIITADPDAVVKYLEENSDWGDVRPIYFIEKV